VLTFVLFVVYQMLIETIGIRQGWLHYTSTAMPFGVPQPLLSAAQALCERGAERVEAVTFGRAADCSL